MAIARVNITNQSSWGVGGASYSSTAINHTTGNTIVVVTGGNAISGQSVGNVTDTAGNTYVKAVHCAGLDAYREEIWYAKNITGHANNIVTATWTQPLDYMGIVVIQYSGLSITSSLDGVASGTTAAPGTTVTTGTLTTTQTDTVHIIACRWGLYSVDTITWPSGFSASISGTSVNELVSEKFVSGTPYVGTYAIIHTNTSHNKLVLVASFAASVSTNSNERTSLSVSLG